jgi:hypothetical protein
MFQVEGLKVAFKHDRTDLRELPPALSNRAKEASTLCMVFDTATKEMVAFGWHTCQKPACFNKNIQRKEAMKHAIQDFDRDLRTQFWMAYFEKRHGKVT